MSTLAQSAYRHLREDILRGALPAGQPLRLEQLKARYGVSFSPLREAMNRLLAERLLVTAPARGFAVAPLSWDELHDTTETRILIETEALRRSIARGDAAWEDAMSAALHLLDRQHDRVAALGDRAGYDDVSLLEDRHAAFHLSLIAACGSPRLLALCDQFNTETLREYPQLEEVFAQLSPLLTDETMRELNARVDQDGEEPGDVAYEWMVEQGLITPAS